MKKFASALLLSSFMVAPAVAGSLTDFDPYDSPARYFGPAERIFAPIINEFERYPRPAASLTDFDIPDGAGAPVPVDPVDLVGSYAPGQVAVPLQARRVVVSPDAKGSALRDHRSDSRAAW